MAKAYAHWITVNYRESYNLIACSGICFNHESSRRGLEFVTRKVEVAEDYVIATGESRNVWELVKVAFAYVGLPVDTYVMVDPKLLRPAEVDILVGDPSKAKSRLGWQPRVSFEEMIHMMIDADLKRHSMVSTSGFDPWR